MTAHTLTLAIKPRPRTHWQAMDAGFLFARQHYGQLLLLALMMAAPITLMTSSVLLLDLSIYVAFFVQWWLKPLYELPILLYLSKALFNQKPSVKGALSDTRKNLGSLLASYLSIYRLSPLRSFTAPVIFLEQQRSLSKTRKARTEQLTHTTNRSFLLLLACYHFELIAFYLSMGLLLFVQRSDVSVEHLLMTLADGANVFVGYELLAYLAIAMVLICVVAPFYVSAGFMLYINRRAQIEAWDIEQQFNDLKNRADV